MGVILSVFERTSLHNYVMCLLDLELRSLCSSEAAPGQNRINSRLRKQCCVAVPFTAAA
jgi:hypothetical protein